MCKLLSGASQVVLVVKNPPANAGDAGSIPGSGRSPGGGNGNPLVFLPEKFHGQRSLAGCSPWGHKESDTTEATNTHAHTRIWWWRMLSISVPREPPWVAFPKGIYLGGLDLGTHGLLRSVSHLSPRVRDRLTPEQILCRERKAVNNLEPGMRH